MLLLPVPDHGTVQHLCKLALDDSDAATKATSFYFFKISPRALALTHLVDLIAFALFGAFAFGLRQDFFILHFPLVRQDDLLNEVDMDSLSFKYTFEQHEELPLQNKLDCCRVAAGIDLQAWQDGLRVRDNEGCTIDDLGYEALLEQRFRFPLSVQWRIQARESLCWDR